MAKLVALLPFVQLPHGAGHRARLLRCEAEVAEAVLGVLVLSLAGGRGAMAGRLWQGLVGVLGELGLGRGGAAGQGVLSRRRARRENSRERSGIGNVLSCDISLTATSQ